MMDRDNRQSSFSDTDRLDNNEFSNGESWDDEKTIAPWMLPEDENQESVQEWDSADDEKTVAPWMMPEEQDSDETVAIGENPQMPEYNQNLQGAGWGENPQMPEYNQNVQGSGWGDMPQMPEYNQNVQEPGWGDTQQNGNWEEPGFASSWDLQTSSPFDGPSVNPKGDLPGFENPFRQQGFQQHNYRPGNYPPGYQPGGYQGGSPEKQVKKKSHTLRNIVLGVLGVAVLAGIGVGGVYFVQNHSFKHSQKVDAGEIQIAEIPLTHGTNGELDWDISGNMEDGYTLSITGKGALEEDKKNPENTTNMLDTWKNVGGSISTVEIEEGVTGIFIENAFKDFEALEHVSLPDSL
ncbi:MAG: hypothetical protein Q4B26_04210, partial [Eubacteriales bacterium]|nr:hypothetical protein [Eubacteriales bacterium]